MQVCAVRTREDCHRLLSGGRASVEKNLLDLIVMGREDESAEVADICVFRKGIIPAREMCEDGGIAGQWVAYIEDVSSKEFEIVWTGVVLDMISESSVSSDESQICGAVASCQVGRFKIAIWISACADSELKSSGRMFQELLLRRGRRQQILFDSFGAGVPAVVLGPPSVSGKTEGRAQEEKCETSSSQPVLPECVADWQYRAVVRNTFIDVLLPSGSPSPTSINALRRLRSA